FICFLNNKNNMCFSYKRPNTVRALFLLTAKLKKGSKITAGRNNSGRIMSFNRGGGLKIKYRFIDFWRRVNAKGIVIRFETDPYRNAFIALVVYVNGFVSYIVAVEELFIGQEITSGLLKSSGDFLNLNLNGSALPLAYIP